jgi:hypothetical protein
MGQTDGWHFYKEAPETITPIQIESTDDGTVYILSKDRKMYYREVGAETWTQVLNIQAFWNTTTFAVHPVNKRIFLGTQSQGIQMSDNYGESWQHEFFFTIPNSGNHQGIFSIAIDVENDMILLGGGVNVSTLEWKAHRSFNNGDTWQDVDVVGTYVELFLAENGNILASSELFGLFRSVDGGLTWSSLGMENVIFNDFAEDDNGVIYGTVNNALEENAMGVYTSNDGGLNWTLSNTGLGNTEATSIAYDAINNEVLLGSYDGLYSLNNAGWVLIEIPYDNPGVKDIHIIENTRYLGSELGGVDKKEEQDDMWISHNQGFSAGISDFLFNEAGALYITHSPTEGFFVSENALSPWGRFSLPQESVNTFLKVIQMEKSAAGDLYFLDFDELFRSTDDGLNFENLTPSLPPVIGTNFTSFAMMDVGVAEEIMLYQFADNIVYLSTDNGSNYEVLIESSDDDVGFFQVDAMLNSESMGYLVAIQDFNLDKKLLRSEDGDSWHQIDLSAAPQNNSSFNYKLHLRSDGEVIFSIGHQPYILNQDETLEVISVPWTQTNSNASYSLDSDALGRMYITTFPTFGSLDYEGIWQADEEGENWTNLGFPGGANGDEIYSTELNFDGQNVPFIIADDQLPSPDDADRKVALYYFGPDDIFTATNQLSKAEVKVLLYPNPVDNDGVITLESTAITGETILICYDIQGRRMDTEVEVSEGRAQLKLGNLTKGVYLVQIVNEDISRAVRVVVD